MLEFSDIEKNIIISTIKDILNLNKKVKFAYIYGSFIEQSFSKDIDIAVYCSEIDSIFSFQADMGIEISDQLRKKGFDISPDEIDLRVINNAPYDFLIEIFDRGMLIVDKNTDLRTDIIDKVSTDYRINQIVLSEFYR